MADIRIKDLPVETSPVASEVLAIDGAFTRQTTIQKVVDIGAPIASQAEAEAGVQATKRMTPLSTAQAITARAATLAQGTLADSAVQPGDLAQVATSGDYDDLANQPSLSADLIYPVKADAIAATIPASEHALKLNGITTEGDGLGGLYIDTDNGSTDTFTSNGGTRTWYRAEDVGETRLVTAVSNALSPVDATYRKSVVQEYPLNWPDYATALAALGGVMLYPQGACYDDDGYFYRHYASGTTRSAIVVYDAAGAYLSWFSVLNGGESIVCKGSALGGDLKLFKQISTNLAQYDLNTLPANAATVDASSTPIADGSVALQYAFGDGRWIVEQNSVDLGVERSRTVWNIYDETFVFVGNFYVSKSVVGFQTTANPNYNYIPKSQGVALANGKVYFGIGGSYIPASEPGGPTRAADFGVVECNYDGSVARYGVVKADALITKITDLGYSIERTESEGVFVHPNGELHNLFVTMRPSSVDASTTGVLTIKEFDTFGLDWSDIPSLYVPFDAKRLSMGIWPRSPTGMNNPVSNVAFSTMMELLDFMVDFQLLGTAYFTGAVALTPISGLPSLSQNYRVEIDNLNNVTFHLRLLSTTTSTEHLFVATGGVGAWVATPISRTSSALILTNYTADAVNKTANILLKSKTLSAPDILALMLNSTGTNSMNIGGGDAAMRAMQQIVFYTTVNESDLNGTARWRMNTIGTFRPETDDSVDLGGSTTRIKNTFTKLLSLVDGATAPSTLAGHAQMYVDSADGDYKIKFGDGFIRTLGADS